MFCKKSIIRYISLVIIILMILSHNGCDDTVTTDNEYGDILEYRSKSSLSNSLAYLYYNSDALEISIRGLFLI
ncbi:MAG: hypothetical protein WCY62_04685 [Clostridia bacterium]